MSFNTEMQGVASVGGSGSAGPVMVPPKSQIQSEFEELSSTVKALEQMVDTLESRLMPILYSNTPSVAESKSAPVPSGCPLAMGIRDQNDRLNVIGKRLYSILSSIQL